MKRERSRHYEKWNETFPAESASMFQQAVHEFKRKYPDGVFSLSCPSDWNGTRKPKPKDGILWRPFEVYLISTGDFGGSSTWIDGHDPGEMMVQAIKDLDEKVAKAEAARLAELESTKKRK